MAARWFDSEVEHFVGEPERFTMPSGGHVWLPSSDGGLVDVAPLDPFPRRSVLGLLWRLLHWRTR